MVSGGAAQCERQAALPGRRSRADGRRDQVGAADNRESTQFLTNGRQHALDLINGHFVSAIGNRQAGLELGDQERPLADLVTALDELPRRTPRVGCGEV